MANDNVPASKVLQHERGYLAGKRPFCLPVNILSPNPYGMGSEKGGKGRERRKRRADEDLGPRVTSGIQERPDLRDKSTYERHGLAHGLVHLPVSSQ
jgi:hypothetical protein